MSFTFHLRYVSLYLRQAFEVVEFVPTTRRWHDRRKPRDAGDWYARQMSTVYQGDRAVLIGQPKEYPTKRISGESRILFCLFIPVLISLNPSVRYCIPYFTEKLTDFSLASVSLEFVLSFIIYPVFAVHIFYIMLKTSQLNSTHFKLLFSLF